MINSNGWLFLVCMLAGLVSVSARVVADTAGDGDAAPAARGAYSAHSDRELTALAASWSSLDVHERRALLTEMKVRMASRNDRQAVIRIRTERRYGRLIRQPDGSVIRIEAQVVQLHPVTEEELIHDRHGFGVGFERRVAERQPLIDIDRLLADPDFQRGMFNLELVPFRTLPERDRPYALSERTPLRAPPSLYPPLHTPLIQFVSDPAP